MSEKYAFKAKFQYYYNGRKHQEEKEINDDSMFFIRKWRKERKEIGNDVHLMAWQSSTREKAKWR